MSVEGAPDDPWELLEEWLPANDDPVRPTMTVTTIAADGGPDARIQLLSEFDRQGFYFHTDARSRKVAQLAANASVALVVHLPEQLHQLVVRGPAEPADHDELDRAFRHRSPYLQQLAWQNTPEFAALPLPERLAGWAEFASEHPSGFEQPPTWAGYLVRPTRLTFWFGNPDTASRRVEYTRTPQGWEVTVLAG